MSRVAAPPANHPPGTSPGTPDNIAFQTILFMGLEARLQDTIERLGDETSPGDIVHTILRNRLPFWTLDNLASATSFFKTEDIRELLGVSKSTFYRRKNDADGDLSLLQTASVYRFAEILTMAQEIFGSKEATDAWLDTPNRFLNKERPIDLILTPPGADRVRDYLIQVSTGTYV